MLGKCIGVYLAAMVVGTATLATAKEATDYPITVKVVETKTTTSVSQSGQSNTKCSEVGDDVDCTTRRSPAVKTTTMVQVIEAPDGNTYELICLPGAWTRFRTGAAQGGQASAGTLTQVHEGCSLQPGTYQARQEKGRFKVLVYDEKHKPHEWTFGVLSSRPTRSKSEPVIPDALGIAQSAAVTKNHETATVTVTSRPEGADIEIDGKFMGHTPSELILTSGQHQIRITKKGFTEFARGIEVSAGSKVAVKAELEERR